LTGEYRLILAVFYEDSKYDYAHIIFNQPVKVLDSDQTVDFRAFLSMILAMVVMFLISFIIYVKATNKIYGVPVSKKKKGNESILDMLRDMLSA
jgi:hypothetical protein